MTPQQSYESILAHQDSQLKSLKKKKSLLAWLRLLSIVLAAGIIYVSGGFTGFSIISSVLLLIIFSRLIYADIANRDQIRHTEYLMQITGDELQALKGFNQQFPDGEEWKPKEHPYAADIDILGHASLFQYCNRTNSAPGASLLANWLLHPANKNTILLRQESVKELAGNIHLRQELQAYGKEYPISIETVNRLKSWLSEPPVVSGNKFWIWMRFPMSFLGIASTMAVITGWLPENMYYSFLLLMGLIAYYANKLTMPVHEKLSRVANQLQTLSHSLALLEKESFKAPLLQDIQRDFTGGPRKASARLKALQRILDRLDLRYNIVLAVPLNVLLLWDIHQIFALDKWKSTYGDGVEKWFSRLAEMETLESFACMHFNHPDWVFPTIEDGYFNIRSTELGHPLIPEKKRVTNPLQLASKGSVLLVTGSNMAGKSTYLRSVGVNVVLAMAGAPVCAGSFSLTPVQLMSSMRIADNLEESTSTFYAELKKLKQIIENVNAGKPVFVLLDEILRGTNSHDRHTGSDALIRQLIRHDAAAIVATHDLELTAIEKDFPQQIINQHFDVQVQGEELYFDYKLKNGICTSMNASILMRKIGIEYEEK